MIKDRFNEYFTKLYNVLAISYPTLQKTTKLTDKPAKLPTMYFRQIGGSMQADNLSGYSVMSNLGLEVQFFAAKQADTRKLANLAMEYMVETLFFRCVYNAPLENVDDSNIFRHVCRFEKTET